MNRIQARVVLECCPIIRGHEMNTHAQINHHIASGLNVQISYMSYASWVTMTTITLIVQPKSNSLNQIHSISPN